MNILNWVLKSSVLAPNHITVNHLHVALIAIETKICTYCYGNRNLHLLLWKQKFIDNFQKAL